MMLIGVLSVLLVAIGSLGLFGIGQSNDALKSVFEDRTIPAGQLGRINALVLHSRLAVNIALLSPTPEVVKECIAEIESNMTLIGKEWDAYMATYLTPDEAQVAKTFASDRRKRCCRRSLHCAPTT